MLWGLERSYVLIAASSDERSSWVSIVASSANEARASASFRRQIASVASLCELGSPLQLVSPSDDGTVVPLLNNVPVRRYWSFALSLAGPLGASTPSPRPRDASRGLPGGGSLAKVNVLGDEESFTAPVFTPDDAATQCERCESSFVLFFNPRHHCRACGKLVCGACSASKAPLWRGVAAPVERVCKPCFATLSSLLRVSGEAALSGSVGAAASPLASHSAVSETPATARPTLGASSFLPDVRGSSRLPSTAVPVMAGTERALDEPPVVHPAQDSVSPFDGGKGIGQASDDDTDDPCAAVLGESQALMAPAAPPVGAAATLSQSLKPQPAMQPMLPAPASTARVDTTDAT